MIKLEISPSRKGNTLEKARKWLHPNLADLASFPEGGNL